MKFKKKIKYGIATLCPVILAFLSNLPNEHSSIFVKFFIQHKLTISVICVIALFMVELCSVFFMEDHIIRNWTRKFLRFIAKEKLGGAEYNTRISILRPQKGWRFILKYIWYAYFVCFIENFKKHSWKKVFQNTPIHLFSDYLTVYARYSYPRERISMTHFRVSGANECNGVADKCFKEGIEIEVMTCNISNCEIPESYDLLDELRMKERNMIKKYMKESFFDSSHFTSLQCMNTKANNLYALAISNEDEEIWGVLIIDNVKEGERSFKEELRDVVADYAKIFCFTLSTVK